MDGIEAVVVAVEARLRSALPPKLAELRARYSVPVGDLEDITTWLTHEPDDIGVDRPPMIVIAEQAGDTLEGPVRLSGDGTGGSVYKWRYRLTVFAWARGTTFDSTAQARRRYGLAVREVLLQKLGIGPVDPGSCVLDPTSFVETYSEVARDGASREIIAATAITVDYDTQEHLGPLLPPVGVVASPPSAATGFGP